jgi:hypothetical protein
MARSYTSSASASAIALYQYLESKEYDVGQIYRGAGINVNEIRNPSARVPYENFERLHSTHAAVLLDLYNLLLALYKLNLFKGVKCHFIENRLQLLITVGNEWVFT